MRGERFYWKTFIVEEENGVSSTELLATVADSRWNSDFLVPLAECLPAECGTARMRRASNRTVRGS